MSKNIIRNYFQFFISITLLANASCIHVANHETKPIEPTKVEKNTNQIITAGPLKIEGLIFNERKLPLSDFIDKLMSGDFKDALSKLSFKYTPSNTNNKMLTELMKEGLVPVYAKITNTSDHPVKLSEVNFFLYNKNTSYQALSAEHLPNEFSRFNSAAFVADVVNVTAIVIGSFMLVGLLAASTGGKSLILPSGGSSSSSDSIINDTDKTVDVDFQNFLIQKCTLNPGESTSGLLFFDRLNDETNQTLYLKYD